MSLSESNGTLQRIFTETYVNVLKKASKSNVTAYTKDSFECDVIENSYPLQGVKRRVVQLIGENDFDDAIAFYSAYETLPPLIASEECFWTYLTHIDYFSYVKKRWKINETSSSNSIIDRFFGHSTKNALARLWWTVKLTKDDTLENPYLYTEVLLKKGNSDLMQNFIYAPVLVQNSEAVKGVLKFFHELKDEDRNNFSELNRKIVQTFNGLGGAKKLLYMDKDYFYSQACRIYKDYKDTQVENA